MSEQILLLNPRRRRKTNRRYKYRRNRRSAPRARRRNRRRRGLPAGLRRYMASRRRNPRRYKYRRNRRAAPRARARRRNPRRFHHRARRRNPRFNIGSMGRGVVGQYVMPALIGGAGGFGVDWVWGKFSPRLPPSLQAGWVGAAVKSAVAITLATVAGRFLPKYRRQIHMAGVGAVTIIAGKAITGAAMSAGVSGLSGYMDYQSYALPGMRMHGYIPNTLGSLEDLYSPAAVIQPAGTAVPRQFGGLGGYIAAQPHLGGGGGFMGYDWQNDGM